MRKGRKSCKHAGNAAPEAVDGYLGEALGQAYVAKYFSPEAKQRAQVIVKEIEAAMEQDINGLPWMSATTKQQALVKLQGMANKIGYPDNWRDYSDARSRSCAATNWAMWNALENSNSSGSSPRSANPSTAANGAMTPPTVNAYYDPQMNDINFPAGVLQPPAFDPKSDAAPNYGDTGGTVGHELTHGFDDEGRQFDAQGNLRDWWTEADGKEFEKRASCISDQYSSY